jgi:RimJ/RimL family protein N-acetyltransferase
VGTWHGVELGGIELRGYRLRLRPLEERDASAVAAGMTDPAMQTHWLPVPQPYTPADAETFVAGAGAPADAGTGLHLAIAPDDAAEIVGAVNLRLPGPHAVRAEIRYSVYPAGQGRGYAASASRLLARWSFDQVVASVLIRCSWRTWPRRRPRSTPASATGEPPGTSNRCRTRWATPPSSAAPVPMRTPRSLARSERCQRVA